MKTLDNQIILTDKNHKDLYGELSDCLSKLPAVKKLFLRGSFSKCDSDRASDIDLLLVVEDTSLKQTIADICTTLRANVTLLTEDPWVDTIVPDFGGVGLIFMVEYHGNIIQLDLYITPLSWSKRIATFNEKTEIYSSLDITEKNFTEEENSKKILSSYIASFNQTDQIIMEFLICTFMSVKHIYRSRPTLALKYRYLTYESLAKVFRVVFCPDKIDYKMYDWHTDLPESRSPIIRSFNRSILTIDIYSVSELLHIIHIFEALLYEEYDQNVLLKYKPFVSGLKSYIHQLIDTDYLGDN